MLDPSSELGKGFALGVTLGMMIAEDSDDNTDLPASES